MTRARTVAFLLAVVLGALMSPPRGAHAQDPGAAWPQWGGPARNFHADSASISSTWPPSGPRRIWRQPLGEGYSSVLVAGDTLVTMYRRD